MRCFFSLLTWDGQMLPIHDMGIPCGSFFMMLNFRAWELGQKRLAADG